MKTTFDFNGLTVTATFAPDEYGRPLVAELHLTGRAITTEDIRRIPIAQLEAEAANPCPVDSLDRCDGESASDFSARVATAYRQAASFSAKPAHVIAQTSGVTAGTANNWIHEARLRGLLPQGNRRKALK